MVWLAIIFVSLTLAVSIIGGHYVLMAADRRERGLPDHWATRLLNHWVMGWLGWVWLVVSVVMLIRQFL